MGNLNMNGPQENSIKIIVNIDKSVYLPNEFIEGTFSFIFPPPRPQNPNPNQNMPRNQPYPQKNPPPPPQPQAPKNPVPKITSNFVYISIIQEERAQGRLTKNVLLCQPAEFPQLTQLIDNPQLIFPFEVKIPVSTLPSFEYPLYDANCSVRTYVKIEVREIKAVGSAFFIIKKTSSPLNSPLELSTTNDRGMYIGASYEANSYEVGGKIPFGFQVDFTSTNDKIKSIEYTLLRRVQIMNGRKYNDVLCKYLIKGEMTSQQNGDGLVQLFESEHLNKFIQVNKLPMLIMGPDEVIHLMPSINAQNFKCEYLLLIEATAAGELRTKVTLEMPFDVYTSSTYNFNLKNAHPQSAQNNYQNNQNPQYSQNQNIESYDEPAPPSYEEEQNQQPQQEYIEKPHYDPNQQNDPYQYSNDQYNYQNSQNKYQNDQYKYKNPPLKHINVQYKYPSSQNKYQNDQYKYQNDQYKYPNVQNKYQADPYKNSNIRIQPSYHNNQPQNMERGPDLVKEVPRYGHLQNRYYQPQAQYNQSQPSYYSSQPKYGNQYSNNGQYQSQPRVVSQPYSQNYSQPNYSLQPNSYGSSNAPMRRYYFQ